MWKLRKTLEIHEYTIYWRDLFWVCVFVNACSLGWRIPQNGFVVFEIPHRSFGRISTFQNVESFHDESTWTSLGTWNSQKYMTCLKHNNSKYRPHRSAHGIMLLTSVTVTAIKTQQLNKTETHSFCCCVRFSKLYFPEKAGQGTRQNYENLTKGLVLVLAPAWKLLGIGPVFL